MFTHSALLANLLILRYINYKHSSWQVLPPNVFSLLLQNEYYSKQFDW